MVKLCDYCGAEIKNPNSQFCPNCGNALKGSDSNKNKKLYITASVLIILIFLVSAFILFSLDQNTVSGNVPSAPSESASHVNYITYEVPSEDKNDIDGNSDLVYVEKYPSSYEEEYLYQESSFFDNYSN